MKKWRVESKSYKLDVCILDSDILDDYSDAELFGCDLYKNIDICRTTLDSIIINVVVKLELSV